MTDARPIRSSPANEAAIPAAVQRRILQALSSLAYGSVEIVVHDSRVVQIERRERVRFERAAGGADDGIGPPRPGRQAGGTSAHD